MTRHYRDQHQEKFGPANIHMKFVQDLANFGSGRGECQFCRVKIMNVQIYHCCVIFQFAAMIGHIFQPANYPVMPCLKRPWHPAMTTGIDVVPNDVPLPVPAAKKPAGWEMRQTTRPIRLQ